LVEIAKIIPPRLSNVLPRPRLLKQLEHHRDKKLILIVGQAAQGKSTLAAAYVAGQSWPSAWINLGPEDSDPANLFYLTAQALQRVLSGVDLAPILIYPTMTTGPREEAPLFREWGRALFSLLPEPSLLVFDGLDRLRPEAPAHRFLQILVEEAPSHLHLCMLSRELPPLEIQTMRIKQEAFVLANEDLAFTLWETRNFLKKVRGLLLSAEAVKHIHELTEGWVGGLVLLAEALERLPKKQREQYCLEVLAGKFAGEVFYFFGEWAYSSHPVEVQDFLLKSSLLDTLEPEMLRDFTGSGKARDILEDLSRRNLFVLAVFDRKKGWCYRYHQLFRDFLQDKVKRRWNREQQSAAYVQAASLYEQEGDLEEAVEYYLRGTAPCSLSGSGLTW
jgi:ATP/maltotriose-dependent transcriptional regulator MalT